MFEGVRANAIVLYCMQAMASQEMKLSVSVNVVNFECNRCTESVWKVALDMVVMVGYSVCLVS